MVSSMTAFAREAVQDDGGYLAWEIRSVNHRYLDLSFKIPEWFRSWEIDWKSQVSQLLSRGKVECVLSFTPSQQTAPQLHINTDLVDKLFENCQAIMQYPGVSTKLKATEILRWPEVLVTKTVDLSVLKEPLRQLLDKALMSLRAMREREGNELKQFIEEKCEAALIKIQQINTQQAQSVQVIREKITKKLEEYAVSVDTTRFEQEIVYYAQKMDVTEEMERLQAHAHEVKRILTQGQSIGRRLDFLMQEMAREANTLASKSQHMDLTNTAVDLKVLIEQMREQIQNVE